MIPVRNRVGAALGFGDNTLRRANVASKLASVEHIG